MLTPVVALLRSVVEWLRGTDKPQLKSCYREEWSMRTSKKSASLLVALTLFLQLVSSAEAIEQNGTLTSGQETYYEADFKTGVQHSAIVAGYTQQADPCCWEVTVTDSNGVVVGRRSCPPDPLSNGYCGVYWTPHTTPRHRITIRNTAPTNRYYKLFYQ